MVPQEDITGVPKHEFVENYFIPDHKPKNDGSHIKQAFSIEGGA